MQIDGPRAEFAAAGKGQARLTHPRGDRPQKHNGGTHLPHETVGNVAARDTARIDDQGVPLSLGAAAEITQNIDRSVNIGQTGTVM